MADRVKLGDHIPTMYVTSKIEKTDEPMRINVSDFNPKLHAKIDESSPAEPKPKAKPGPKAKPKPQ